MISRGFSNREKVMLIILTLLMLGALYFLVVYRPTAAAMEQAEARIDEIADLMLIEEAKAERIREMRQALDAVVGTENAKTITPTYDNFQNLLNELNKSLLPTESFKLNFQELNIGEGVAKRELQMIFNAGDYFAARDIIAELYAGPYRCDIVSLKLSAADRDVFDLTQAPVTVTMSMVYYEIYK